jgi:4-aminobutyrate aminotransferase/(S)-3-amino-2-methylpropionate transaminase
MSEGREAELPTNLELQARKDRAMPRGFANLHPVFADRALDAELWDVEGRRYIDFTSGIAVVGTGHLHPRIVAAVRQQLERFTHTCLQVVPYESAVLLAERLNRAAPGPSPKKTLFVTTGAEAIENAVKIAKCHTRRQEVIAFHGGFHGRTHLGMALTGKVSPYKRGFGTLQFGIHHAPFPMPVHGVSTQAALDGLEALFRTAAAPDQVAAIVVEPVQGEGGFYPAPAEFIGALRRICTDHGIVLICDEVQTGFGRTGRLFATEHYPVEPDLIAMAKGLAGGVPLAAVCGKAAIMDAPDPGGLGGTYAGSPLGTAAALAVLEVIEKDGLLERSRRLGRLLVDRVSDLAARRPDVIGEVRSLGAMVAMELFVEADPNRPATELTKRLIAAARGKGLLLLSCGMHGNVIRFLPPLTIPEALVLEGLQVLDAALEESLVRVRRADALRV